MKSDFFYSKSTKIYVARNPLKIDGRIKEASRKLKIKIEWDDEGRINKIDFDNAKKLLFSLGSRMLTLKEYWFVLNDAIKLKDREMIESLTSRRFCEWLDRVYLKGGFYIDKPNIVGKFKYSGKKQKSSCPQGRPGWFNPERDINLKTGEPKKIKLFRKKFATSWKYWSPDFSVTKLNSLAPIRGYVTSIGKPSLDLGIPTLAKHPMMMIRECRKELLNPPIEMRIITKAYKILEAYKKIDKNSKKKRDYLNFQKKEKNYITFLKEYGKLFRSSKDLVIYDLRESFFNVLGLFKILNITKDVSFCGSILSGIKNKKINISEFFKFVETSKNRLKSAIKKKKDIVFVMGHKNPDTDTVISCLFEAFRNQLIDKDRIEYIPIIQNYKIPDEAEKLLGRKICKDILLDKNKLYTKAKKMGIVRWISVDQNREPEVQKYFIAMIDHHIPCETAINQDMPKTLEMVGSTASLVYQKMLGMGLDFDMETSKILYGATLMDTENRIKHKMTYKDKIIMNKLKKDSLIKEDNKFYGTLMSYLLNTDNPEVLFKRDYKEDWGFGFAVAKIKFGFDKNGKILKKDLIKRAVELAKENNKEKNLPLTILRITDYKKDNITVNRERVYLIFNKKATFDFKKATFELLIKIIKFNFEKNYIKKTKEYVEFWGTGMQLSRKKTAPIIEPLVNAFNEYFFSSSNKLWIKRDFLKKSSNLIKALKELRIKKSFDYKKRLNYITYFEAKNLAKKLNFSILSLKEYWLALKDAKEIKDEEMINSLQGSNFVEFLDSVIKKFNLLLDHPVIKDQIIRGKSKKIKIPKGKPGLIHPNEINFNTGLPKKVRDPDEYGNSKLWRYWEPDSELVVPTRSYIFLLKQPCLDGKFHPEDSLPNLGIRICKRERENPKIKIQLEKNKLKILIEKEGDLLEYVWKK